MDQKKENRKVQAPSPNVHHHQKRTSQKSTMSRKVSISSLTLSEPMTKPARVQVNPEDIDDLDKTQQVNNHQYNI